MPHLALQCLIVIICSFPAGDVFGPLEFSRRDLMAINIQRGRDHGIPDYNTARMELNLSKITEWRDINPELYDSPEPEFEGVS